MTRGWDWVLAIGTGTEGHHLGYTPRALLTLDELGYEVHPVGMDRAMPYWIRCSATSANRHRSPTSPSTGDMCPTVDGAKAADGSYRTPSSSPERSTPAW